MKTVINLLGGLVSKITPLKGARTNLVALVQLGYGVFGILTGNLTGEAGALIITTALGLIFAAEHTPS